MLYILLTLILLPLDPCLIVEGPHIQARDLIPQLPAFATLDPTTVLASSPNFGVRRDLTSQTLRLWATSHSLSKFEFDPVCVYRRAALVEDFAWESELRQALSDLFGLQVQDAGIEIRDTRISPGPAGHIALQQNGLSYDTVKKQYIWHGKIEGPSGYAALRINFTMKHGQSRMVAVRNLLAGKLVEASDFESILLPWQPTESGNKEFTIEFEGRVLRRSLTKGAILHASHLMQAPLIRPGDAVELISQAGRAIIRTPAIARGKARLGDPVLIATLDGKRLLRAVAVAPGIVEIRTGAAKKEQ